jgi:hypothetical protein
MAEVEDIIDILIIELRASGSYLLKDQKMTTGNLMLTCINHGGGTEKKPSMGILTHDVVRPSPSGPKKHKAGSVNCFTCGYVADLPEFISACFGHDDRGYFGQKWIASNFINLSIDNRRDIQLDMSRDGNAIEEAKPIDEGELDSYRFIHPYMYERKLTDRVIEYFDVGYDKKKHCLTFPVHDLRGAPIFFQRRSISGKQFLNDVTTLKGTVLYGMYHVYKNLSWIDELYITESIIDALTLWGHRKAAVATMQAIPTPTQLALLRKVPIRQLINAQDMDDAGDKGAKRIRDVLSDSKLVYRAEFDGKDINELDDYGINNIFKQLM